MWAWLATLATVIGSVFVAYVFARFLDLTTPSIDREITDVSVVVITQLTTLASIPITWGTSTFLTFGRNILMQPKRVIFLVVFTSLAIAFHYEHQKLAPIVDRFWRCGVGKAFDEFLVPLLQVGRLLYAIFIPIYNFWAATVAQIFRGTPIILAKCQVSELLAPVTHLGNAFKDFFYALGAFFGLGAPINQSNNIAVNEFELEPAARSTLLAVAALKSGVQCACESLEDVTNILFRVLESPNAAKAFDHGINVLVRIVQMFLRIVIPPHEAPKPERVLYHLYGFWITSAMALDDGIFAIVENIVKIFAPKTTLNLPKEFIFTALTRWGTGEVQRLIALFGLGPWSVTVPEQWSDSTAMMARWRPDEAYSNMYIASYDAGVVVQWVIYLAENLIAGLASEGKALTPQPTTLDCDWGRDLKNQVSWPKGSHFLSYTAGCSVYHAGLAWFGWQHVLHSFAVEAFFTTIVRQEQSFLRLAQKYDGMWTSRRNPITCESRQHQATPIGHVAEDWTVQPTQCRCDMHLGSYHAPDPNHRTFNAAQIAAYESYTAYEAAYHDLYNTSSIGGHAASGPLGSLYNALDVHDRALVDWLHTGSTTVVNAWKGLTHVEREIWEDVFSGSSTVSRTPPTLAPEWNIWSALRRSTREEISHGLQISRTSPPPDGRDAVYNSWCGQPTLQAQVFDPIDGLLVHVLHGLFGPTGIGELLAEMPVTPPYSRLFVEGGRMFVRFILSIPDIFELRWAFYDINCGYGLNETHLLRRWNTYYRGESVAWREMDNIYIEENGKVDIATQDELRWRICEARGYKIPKLTDGKSFDFDSRSKLCADNSQSGCMCNWNTRLERDSPCQCIAHFPEDASLASPDAEIEVRERFTSDAVSSRWCNKLSAEWLFYHLSIAIDAAVWILQLGPIKQAECGLASLQGKASLFSEDDTRIAEAWVEIPTSEAFFDETLYYNVLSGDVSNELSGSISNEYQDSVTTLLGSSTRVASLSEYTALIEALSEKNAYEGPGPYVTLDVNDAPLGTKAFTIADTNVSMGNGEFDPSGSSVYQTALFCVQEENARSRIAGTLPDLSSCEEISQAEGASFGTCRVYGNTEVTCASAMAVRTASTGLLYALRRITEATLGSFGGDLFGVDMNPTTFLCLYAKFLGSQSAMLPAYVPFLPDSYRKSFSKILFGFASFYLVSPVKIATSINWFLYKNLAKTVELILQGKSIAAVSSQIKDGISETTLAVIRMSIDSFKELLYSLGEFFDMWGAGEIFRIGASNMDIVKDALTGAFFEYFGLVVELTARYFAVLSGKSNVADFIEVFYRAIFTLVEMLFQNQFRLMFFMLKLMGPVGDWLKDFVTGTCHVLNTILCGLQKAGCLGFCSCSDALKCVSLRSTHRRLSSIQDLHMHDGTSATHWSHGLVWNGTSLCDHFMDALEDSSYADLRPLERAQWYECLESRALGVEMQRELAIPELYLEDIFYNWRRKWTILHGLMLTASAYFQLWWAEGRVTEHRLRQLLVMWGVPATPYVHMYTQSRMAFTMVDWNEVGDRVLKDMDPNYRDGTSTSLVARLYRLSGVTSNTYDKISTTWQRRHGMRALHKLTTTSMHMPDQSILRVPHILRTGGTTAWNRIRTIHSAPRRTFRAPIKTNITRVPPTHLCPNDDFCFQCAILDNFIDQMVTFGEETSDFYGNVFAAEKQTSARACTPPCKGIAPDVIHYFDMYFKNASNTVLDSIVGLGAVYDATVRADLVPRWDRVGDDWNRLFAGQVSVDESIDAFARFIETANDTYVPFVGYGLPYVITYPIAETCDYEAIFSKQSTQEDRLRRFDSAVVGILFAFLIIFTSSFWSFIPFGSLLGSFTSLLFAWWIGLYIVYGWLPTCGPTLPYMLMEDVTWWIRTRLDPGCFCTMFPTLTNSFCKASTCDVCFVEKVASYENCLDRHPIMTDWSILWNGPFMLRWLVPDVLGAVVEYTDVFDGSNTSLAHLARAAYELPNDTDPHMLDCFYLTAMNLPINAFVWSSAFYVGSGFVVQLGIFAFNLLLTIGTLIMLFGRIALSITK